MKLQYCSYENDLLNVVPLLVGHVVKRWKLDSTVWIKDGTSDYKKVKKKYVYWSLVIFNLILLEKK